MSAPVEFFTLRLLPGEIHHLDTLRDLQITNVSYSDPENLKGKKRSVLRVHYAGNPIDLEDDEDEDRTAEGIRLGGVLSLSLLAPPWVSFIRR